MSHEHTAFHAPIADLASVREQRNRKTRPGPWANQPREDHPRGNPTFTCGSIGDRRVSAAERSDRLPHVSLAPVSTRTSFLFVLTLLACPAAAAIGLYFLLRG